LSQYVVVKDEPSGLWLSEGKLVIPELPDVIEAVIKEHHDTAYGGHLGVHKTVERIRRVFWWNGMVKDITEYVQSCQACQTARHNNAKPSGQSYPILAPTAPWQKVHIDFAGPFRRRAPGAGHNMVMIVVDSFTKMARFIKCPRDVDGRAAAELFLNNVWCLFGQPEVIVTDRGPQFSGSFWKMLHERMGTRVGLTASCHPQANGQAEVMVKQMKKMLTAFENNNQRWWAVLPACEFAYNDSVNSMTGHTPFYLNYGRHPRTPFQSYLTKEEDTTVQEWVIKLHENINHACAEAKRNTEVQKERQREHTNQHRAEAPVYQVGDSVYVERDPAHGLDAKRSGPHTVLEVRNQGRTLVIADWPNPINVERVRLVKIRVSELDEHLDRIVRDLAAFADRQTLARQAAQTGQNSPTAAEVEYLLRGMFSGESLQQSRTRSRRRAATAAPPNSETGQDGTSTDAAPVNFGSGNEVAAGPSLADKEVGSPAEPPPPQESIGSTVLPEPIHDSQGADPLEEDDNSQGLLEPEHVHKVDKSSESADGSQGQPTAVVEKDSPAAELQTPNGSQGQPEVNETRDTSAPGSPTTATVTTAGVPGNIVRRVDQRGGVMGSPLVRYVGSPTPSTSRPSSEIRRFGVDISGVERVYTHGRSPGPINTTPPVGEPLLPVQDTGVVLTPRFGTSGSPGRVDKDGWEIDEHGKRMGTYETWSPNCLEDISVPVSGLTHVVYGPGSCLDTAIAEAYNENRKLCGWVKLSRLRALYGNLKVDEWLARVGTRKISHEAGPPIPQLNGIRVTGNKIAELEYDTKAPWTPTWSMETIRRLRRHDFSLHADELVEYEPLYPHLTWMGNGPFPLV
jgi:hypothetical protein